MLIFKLYKVQKCLYPYQGRNQNLFTIGQANYKYFDVYIIKKKYFNYFVKNQ